MYAIVEVTTSGAEESKSIGKKVVEERLAACANIVPEITSYYWWKDELQEDTESILLLKTKRELVDHLIDRIKELHSYENPSIVALSIKRGSRIYLNWIDEETKNGI